MNESFIEQHYNNNILKNKIVSDELHIGGRKATEYLLAALGLHQGQNVLDVGSGLGATARAAAELYGVSVTGLELVEGLCEEARRITEEKGLTGLCDFIQGSALDMPFKDSSYDAAFMLHVNMNVQNKIKLFNEISRVLKPNSLFCFYEILADIHVESMVYPCPWSSLAAHSFLITPDRLEEIIEDAGIVIETKERRYDFAVSMMQRAVEDQPRPAFVNLLENIQQQRCCPWQYICRKK